MAAKEILKGVASDILRAAESTKSEPEEPPTKNSALDPLLALAEEAAKKVAKKEAHKTRTLVEEEVLKRMNAIQKAGADVQMDTCD